MLTSVPVMPIATPISAFLSAGASLTPSPVIATTLPFFCQSSTLLILCAGDTRAYTETLFKTFISSSSDIASNSVPSKHISPSLNMPISFAIAIAVSLWSPVIITGFIPAEIQSATAFLLSSRGGSVIAESPI